MNARPNRPGEKYIFQCVMGGCPGTIATVVCDAGVVPFSISDCPVTGCGGFMKRAGGLNGREPTHHWVEMEGRTNLKLEEIEETNERV